MKKNRLYRTTSDLMKKEKITIGIILDSSIIPAWVFSTLKEIIQLDNFEIKMIVKYPDKKESEKNNLIHNIYKKFESKRKLLIKNALEKIDIKNIIKNAEIIDYSNKLNNNKLIKVDLIINFTNYELDLIFYKYTKFGIWQNQFYKNYSKNNTFNSFWEVFNNNNVTCVNLGMTYSNKLYLITNSYISTDLLSTKRNTNNTYWKNSSLILRSLLKFEKNQEKFIEEIKKNPSDFYIKKLPKNKDYLLIIIKMMIRTVKARFFQKLFFDQWEILFKFGGKPVSETKKFTKISSKKGFLADPHIIFKNDHYFVFVEETETMNGKGHISIIDIDSNGNYTIPKKILDCPYHLSYPSIFDYQDNYYMIPESHKNKTIEIYKCDKFPDNWKFQQTLFKNIDAVDTTLFQYNEKWWLFTCIKQNSNLIEYNELFIYYSDQPFSENWVSHPMNPVVSDVRKARSAGKIFEKEGKIFRPSQDCSSGYGYRVIINQILKLTENEYEEKEIEFIEPYESKMQGIHTFNSESGMIIIDAKIKKIKNMLAIFK